MVWAAVSGTTAGTADERGRRPNWRIWPVTEIAGTPPLQPAHGLILIVAE
jgi:hypothetical protein